MAVCLGLNIDALGRAPQGQLPQSNQVAFLEKVLDGRRDLRRHIDLARREPLDQFVGRRIDQHHLVGLIEHRIRHRFADPHAAELCDDVIEGLDVLDIERGINPNPGVQKFLDILPSFGMAAADDIGMGQFIDENQRRSSGQRRVEVEFGERGSSILDITDLQRLQSFQQSHRLRPCVGLDITDDHIHPGGGLSTGRF